jgi:Tol biopolymer transport system component
MMSALERSLRLHAMSFESGKSLLHYRLAEKLGEGGMGVVWKAHDTTLDRSVAVKILPDLFVHDPDRLARFEREARVLASLNHPNIAAIYGLHEAQGVRFLAMEFVGGEDLGRKLQEGPLPIDEVVRVGLQLAEGLEAAHEHGVVHRDLKPANVQVTDEGQVKILDFGLAKALGGDPSSSSASGPVSATLTSAGTRAGVILGTAAYMSPEQAKGKSVDRRTDIWAFGAVLYEMLTNRRLFDGETVSEMIASVLKSEPDFTSLPPKTPPALKRLIQRCLEKDPRHRLRDIGDARVALEEIQSGKAEQPAVAGAAPGSSRKLLVWAGIAALVAAIVTAVAVTALRPAPPAAQTLRLEALVTGDQPLLQIQGSAMALSPDGRLLTYVVGTASDVSATRMYLRNLARFEDTPLTGTDAAYNPFFSPDGQWIGFVTPQELKKVSVAGGTPLVLCPVALSRGATWGESGAIVFAPNPASGLMQLPAAGGTPVELTKLENGEISHRWPQFLPGGKRVLFTAYKSGDRNAGRIEVVDVATGKRTVLHEGGTYARYVASGHVLYLNNRTLFAAPFDASGLKLTALPAPVLQDVSTNNEGGGQYDVSDNGTIAFLTGQAVGARNALVWYDRSGRATPVTDTRREYQTPPRLSPDGRRIAVSIIADGNVDVWVHDLERDTQTRLTFDEGRDLFPVWSHDGQYIYFTSNRNAKWMILRKRADGTGTEEQLLESNDEADVYSASADGRYLGFHVLAPTGDSSVLPLGGDHTPRKLFATAASDGDPVFSPDGRWFSYDSDESGRWEVYVRPLEGEGRWQVSAQGGEFARWSKDGQTIFYQKRGGETFRVPVKASGGSIEVGRPEKMFDLAPGMQPDWDVTQDGSRFVLIQGEMGSAASGRNMVKLTFHWLDEMKGLLAKPS